MTDQCADAEFVASWRAYMAEHPDWQESRMPNVWSEAFSAGMAYARSLARVAPSGVEAESAELDPELFAVLLARNPPQDQPGLMRRFAAAVAQRARVATRDEMLAEIRESMAAHDGEVRRGLLMEIRADANERWRERGTQHCYATADAFGSAEAKYAPAKEPTT